MKDGDKIKWVYLKNNPLGLEYSWIDWVQRPNGDFGFSRRVY